jgi:hypothetical protein
MYLHAVSFSLYACLFALSVPARSWHTHVRTMHLGSVGVCSTFC